VVVIGYDAWRNRFASDPGIVGQTLQLGDTKFSVIGVMPEGFAFPLNHRYWIPLRMVTWRHEPRSGPEIMAFARLAPGVTLDGAQSELTTIGQRGKRRVS
jgi:putative ABC transport system permease protein